MTESSARCGYEWDPEWLDNPDVETNFQHCCARETWEDADRCWWHADREKSVDELVRAAAARGCDADQVPGARRETAHNRRLNEREPAGSDELAPMPSELLCGAHLPAVEFRGEFDWRGCWLNDSDLAGANLAGADLRGVDAERVDLADAVLQGADLREADLRVDASGADLRNADLTDAAANVPNKVFASLPRPDFSGAHLGGATLVGTDCSGADLTDARLTDADLSGASLEMTALERANLFGADLPDAELYGAVLSGTQINRETAFFDDGEERCAYHPPEQSLRDRAAGALLWRREATADGERVSDDDSDDDRYSKAAWTYRAIEGLARENSFPALQSRMFLKRQRMQTRMHRRTDGALSGSYLFSRVSGLFISHGEGYLRVLGWGVVVVLAFAVLFPFGGWIRPVGPGGQLAPPITWPRIAEDPVLLWESVYYSTLTFTNLGFGDFRPAGTVGQALTVAETASGAVLLALLVFVLGRRAAR